MCIFCEVEVFRQVIKIFMIDNLFQLILFYKSIFRPIFLVVFLSVNGNWILRTIDIYYKLKNNIIFNFRVNFRLL